MSALLEGFRTGYDRMNQHYQQQENNRRYDEGMQRKQGLDQMSRESHNAQMQNSALNRQVVQNQVDRLPQDNAYTDQVRGLDTQGGLLRNQGYAIDNEAGALELSDKKDTNKQERALQKFQSYATSGQWADMVKDKDFEGTDVELVFGGTGRKAAMGLSDSISNQDWAGATQSFNKLYKPKLNRMVGSTGRNGNKILDVEATGFEPQEDGSIKIPVYVTTEKGGGYNSYVSQLRSSDENDPHKQFSVDELIGKAAGLGNLAAIMESSGVSDAMGERAQKYQLSTNKKETPKKRDWKEVKDEIGNVKGYVDLNTQEYQSLPTEAQEAVMSPEDLAAKNETVKKNTINQTAALIQRNFPNVAGNANAIASRVVQIAEQYKASGQRIDMNQVVSKVVADFEKSNQEYNLKREQSMQNSVNNVVNRNSAGL